MWTTKELFLISVSTGIVFCFITLYSQRKLRQYIDRKVVETSSNPLSSLVNTGLTIEKENTGSLGQKMGMGFDNHEHQEPPLEIKVPETPKPPPGSGERWTPYP